MLAPQAPLVRSRHRARRRHRRRHRRQQPRAPPGAARLARHRPDRQGPAAQPGRLHRARVELHLPGRPLPRDDRPDRWTRCASTRRWACSPSPAAIEVARTEERMEELRRRMSSAQGVGHRGRAGDPGPRRRDGPVPGQGRDPRRASGRPAVGVVDSLRAGTIMRESRAGARRAHRACRPSRCVGMDVERRAGSRGCAPTGGDIEAETVVIACGVWSPKLGRMAGAAIPLTPAVHQMISRRPDARSSPSGRARSPSRSSATWTPSATSASTAPTWRWAPTPTAPILLRRRGDPLDRAVEALPDRAAVHRRRLRPAARAGLRADAGRCSAPTGAEIRYAINGLLSLTPDGAPILGETPEVKGLWSAAAVWIKEGPGVGRAVAEWMTHGHSEIDVHHSDIARFYPHQRTRAHVRARTVRGVQQDLRHRAPRRAVGRPTATSASPDARARSEPPAPVFFETVGWERPFWYESNAALLERVRRRGDAARARVGRPLVVADHQRRAPRDARGAPASSTCPRSPSSTSSGRRAATPCSGVVRRAVRRGRSAG